MTIDERFVPVLTEILLRTLNFPFYGYFRWGKMGSRFESGIGYIIIVMVLVALQYFYAQSHSRRVDAMEQQLFYFMGQPPPSASAVFGHRHPYSYEK